MHPDADEDGDATPDTRKREAKDPLSLSLSLALS